MSHNKRVHFSCHSKSVKILERSWSCCTNMGHMSIIIVFCTNARDKFRVTSTTDADKCGEIQDRRIDLR